MALLEMIDMLYLNTWSIDKKKASTASAQIISLKKNRGEKKEKRKLDEQ